MGSRLLRRCARGAALLLAACGSSQAGDALPANLEPNPVHRLAAGDLDERSVVLWARADEAGKVMFELAEDADFSPPVRRKAVVVEDPRVPAKARMGGLRPATRYHYRARLATGASLPGTFRTPPERGERAGARFGVAGDWRGDMAPYPAIRNAADMDLDVCVELGDTVYADFASPDVPVAQCRTIEEFRDKHREVYSARAGLNTLGALRGSTAVYAVIDDHEVIDDFAGAAHPSTDPRFLPDPAEFLNDTELFETGLRAFLDWNPVEVERWRGTHEPSVEGEERQYRARRFGLDVAFFLLDTRSFRTEMLENPDPLDAADVHRFRTESFAEGRTLLGAPQVEAVEADLLEAERDGVLWKVVLIPEPIQNLGAGNPRDRFEGYAAERTRLLAFVRDQGIRNVVFVAADIHGTIVNNLQYQPTGPDDPQIDVDAFEVTVPAVAYDPPLGPEAVASVSLTPIEEAVYAAMSMDERDALFQEVLDDYLESLGFDPTGLEGSTIDAVLLEGRWVRVNAFGWGAFEVDPATGALTVTIWGIEPYGPSDAAAAADRVPFVLLRFRVTPKA